jgi:DDE superfamily endonuclease
MPAWSLPPSLVDLLACFRGCFTAPTFKTFSWLVAGFLAQPRARTVCGMLAGARLAGRWHHSRAHRFFAVARWSPDQLGLALLALICARLVDPDSPLRLVVDDTLYRRAGRKVWAATWHHDPLAPSGKGRNQVAWANCWVVVGVLVHLPFVPNRAVCLPVLARLWRPRQPGRSKLDLACELVGLICAHWPDRRIHLVCDAAYAGKALARLPAQVTVTTRLRCDAALYQLAPPRKAGQRGRPRLKGERLADLETLAGMVHTPFALLAVTRYGRLGIAAVAHFTCLWPSVFGARPVHVVLVRDPDAPDSFDLALVSTDLSATAAQLVCRYADRWPVEVLFEESRQVAGVGQARNRTRRAVERTVPFGLLCLSLTVVWYALYGQPAADVVARRALAPWYQAKHAVSFADMLVALRRVILAAQYLPGSLVEPTPTEILAVQRAWAAAAA